MFLPVFPFLFDWLKQTGIAMTIVGVLIFTSVIQSVWKPE